MTIEEHYKLAKEVNKLTEDMPKSMAISKLALYNVITVMQAVGNPYGYKFTAQGGYNADIAGDFDGITNADGLVIQKRFRNIE